MATALQRNQAARRVGKPAASAIPREIARGDVYFRPVYLTGELTTGNISYLAPMPLIRLGLTAHL